MSSWFQKWTDHVTKKSLLTTTLKGLYQFKHGQNHKEAKRISHKEKPQPCVC